MTRLREQVLEDRHIRDAARALVETDVANLRADLAVKGLGGRAVDRLTDGAIEVYDEAIEVAADHKGALAAIIAALALWFARHPILDALLGEDDDKAQANKP